MKTAQPLQPTTSLAAEHEIVRPELNLEKWPIWSPSKSKNSAKAKILAREITLADGNRVRAKVEIAPTSRGALTTEDQKVMYGLVKLWEENGKPVNPVYFSKRALARCCGKKWGTNVSASLDQSLVRLRVTPFIWENSYFDKATGEAVEVIDTFNILSDLKIIKRRNKDKKSEREEGYYKFNDFILKNLLSNYTKPLLLDVVLRFTSELAQLLYVHLDLILSQRPIYERRSKELFDDLGLEGESYRHAANRKQLLERAFKELVNVQLSTGVLAQAKLTRTADGTDHKAVFRKKTASDTTGTPPAAPVPDTAPPVPTPTDVDQQQSEAAGLVRYFYQVFHQTSKAVVSNKATDQAIGLIAQIGYEQAKYVIEYAKTAAAETNYQPATFGGILQYVGRGLDAYEENLKAEANKHKAEQQRAKAQTCSYCNTSGWVFTVKGARPCTHDPATEEQFLSIKQ